MSSITDLPCSLTAHLIVMLSEGLPLLAENSTVPLVREIFMNSLMLHRFLLPRTTCT